MGLYRSAIPAAVLAAALSACTYQVKTMSAPNLNVYSNYTNKMPGKWLLTVDTDNAKQDVHSDSYGCSAHVYPMDISSSLRGSIIQTFQNLAQDVEVTDGPVAVDSLARTGYSGVIRVKLDAMRPRLEFIPGFWTVKVRGTVELDGGIIVESPQGRLLGTQAEGHGTYEKSGDCADGAKALGHAGEEAMKSLMGELGERFSNAPQLRDRKATDQPSAAERPGPSTEAHSNPQP